MANSFGTNPIVLDTFTSAIDIGDTLFGDSGMRFYVKSIEWQTPTTADHTAVIKNNSGIDIFNETCVTAKQSLIKYFFGEAVEGMKIEASGVGSGKINILLE